MTNTLLLIASLTITQPGGLTSAPEVTFKSAIEDFEFGEHAQAAEKLRMVLEPTPKLESRENIIVARQYLGACYHLLNDKTKAKKEFSMLLALDQEHRLDPEVFSPALVQFFEEVRKETGLAKQEEKIEKKKIEKKKIEKKKDPPPPPPIEPHSAAFAIIPFGVGQFANEHPVRGALFGVAEVGLFTTAVITFFMFEGLKVPASQQHECDDQSGACVLPEDRDRAETLQTTYLVTFWTGIAVVVAGIVEALISYPGDATGASDAPIPGHPAALGLSFTNPLVFRF